MYNNYTSSTNDVSLGDMKFHLFSFNKVHLKTFVSQNVSLFFSIFPFHRTFSPPYHPAIGSSLGKGSRVDPSKDMVILEQLGSVTQIGCNSPPQGPGWSPQLSQAPWRYGRIHRFFVHDFSDDLVKLMENSQKTTDVMWVSPKNSPHENISQCPTFCVSRCFLMFPVTPHPVHVMQHHAPTVQQSPRLEAVEVAKDVASSLWPLPQPTNSCGCQRTVKNARILLVTTHGLWLLCTVGAVRCMWYFRRMQRFHK